MLAHSLCYEPISPKLVGRETTFHLGKFTGRHMIERRLNLEGIKATSEQVSTILKRIKDRQEGMEKSEILRVFNRIENLTTEIRKGVTDEDFWGIVEETTGQKPKTKSV